MSNAEAYRTWPVRTDPSGGGGLRAAGSIDAPTLATAKRNARAKYPHAHTVKVYDLDAGIWRAA